MTGEKSNGSDGNMKKDGKNKSFFANDRSEQRNDKKKRGEVWNNEHSTFNIRVEFML